MSDNPEQQAPQPGTAPEQPAGEAKAERTFTQADLDRLVKERLEKQQRSILNQLGVSTLDEAKTAAQRMKELDEASKTEMQKLTEKLSAVEQAANQAKAERDAARIQSAVVAEAGAQGIAPDRFKAVVKLLDTSSLTVNADGTVTGVTEAMAALLEESPFLKSEAKPGKPNASPTNPAGMGQQGPDLSWLKQGGTGRTFGDGGLRYSGDKK